MVRTEIHLIRHGQTDWNASGRWQGHADPELSELGREQARQLAEQLEAKRFEVDRVIASDLARAVQTARALSERFDVPLQTLSDLRELHIGRWTGLVREEIAELDLETLEAFEAGDVRVRPGGGETRAEIRVRARRALERLVEAHAGERLLVVTHLGILRALLPDVEPDHCAIYPIVGESLLAKPIGPDGRPMRTPV